MATHTQDPQTGAPASQGADRQPPFWRAPMGDHPLVWTGFALLLIALFTGAVLTYQHLNRPEPAAPPAAEQGVDRATAEAAAQQAFQGYVAALNEAYATRSTSPLTTVASPEQQVSEQAFIDNTLIAGDISVSGAATATAEVADYQVGRPQEGWTTVTLDACLDSSDFNLTLPDGSDARRGPGGDADTDYVTRTQATATLVASAADGGEPGDWVVSGYETDNATPC
ncbi:hypothetical protein [uncultured Pseudokineococcus sp.]|uniref:hypothetical protein n=1 Tax=uncultured Pseudokineococcus sp. TaxID=1642928 RepID=UPI00260F5B95|nr:hypothetical protein [uncultured Pseudokineococcus sp.]